MYMFGGYGGSTRLNDLYSYSFLRRRWSRVPNSSPWPGPRENNGVLSPSSPTTFLVFGGYNGSSWLNDLWEYDAEAQKWRLLWEGTEYTRGRGGREGGAASTPGGDEEMEKGPSER